MSHINQTTIYDVRKVTKINGLSLSESKQLKTLDEIKLKTYSRYTIERKNDVKFKNFNCYVLKATSKSGYSTLNYFDRKNFRLLMVIYPNGNKSLMIEYEFKNSTLINSHIVNTFANSEEKQIIKLGKYQTKRKYSDLWFNCPYNKTVLVPENKKKVILNL